MAVGLAGSQLYCAWRSWLPLTWSWSALAVSVSTVQKNELFFFFYVKRVLNAERFVFAE